VRKEAGSTVPMISISYRPVRERYRSAWDAEAPFDRRWIRVLCRRFGSFRSHPGPGAMRYSPHGWLGDRDEVKRADPASVVIPVEDHTEISGPVPHLIRAESFIVDNSLAYFDLMLTASWLDPHT
jgi:hypothetical protein